MNKNISSSIYYIFLSFVIVCIFLSFAKLSNVDADYQNKINSKYFVFSLIHPDSLNFCGEYVPNSLDIYERFDKELLKNTYWQSNTLFYIKRANKYFPIIEKILKENNIPDDFKYLALIESGFENVVSPSGAAGFWQILKSTAKEYGLEVNSSIDERYNLEKSTKAACMYLKESYNIFNSWTMAAAAYNMGKSGLNKVLKMQKTDNYYNLYLNSETSRYIFRILAVKQILESPNKYGFYYRNNDLYSMLDYSMLEVDSTIPSLTDFAFNQGINYKLLKQYNPWILKNFLPNKSNKKYYIKIVKGGMVFDNINNNLINEESKR